MSADHGLAKRDLTLFLEESRDGVRGWAEYALDLYEGSSIERLLEQLRLVLEGMARDQDQRVMDLLQIHEAQELGLLRELELQALNVGRRKAITQQ